MRRLIAAALVLAAVSQANAQTPAAPPAPDSQSAQPAPPAGPPLTPAPPLPGWVARPVADLQALDKITARVTPLTIRVGESATFGALTIAVRACVVRPPDVASDAAMFLDITDAHQGAPQFHGWMIMSEPAVAMLEHPVYDIRPAGCHA